MILLNLLSKHPVKIRTNKKSCPETEQPFATTIKTYQPINSKLLR
jgi:hypothetical protein